MNTAAIIAAIAVVSGSLAAQEYKPVPKNSMRVTVSGCTRGFVFTAGLRTQDEAGRADIPEGMHLRMNGPKKMIAEIRAHEGSMIEVTGLMKKGQYKPDGVGLGGGVRIMPGSAPGGASGSGYAGISQTPIDVEGWRAIGGYCPSR
jgi:hypothetical protein